MPMSADLRLSLRAMRAFAAVVEHGSISGAARALNTAASAVAAAVDQVEAELGAALLIRTRAKGIVATTEGAAVAERFRALLDAYAEVIDEGRDMARGLGGTLRLGYYAPVAPAFLPRVLEPLMRASEGLQLELRAHDNDSAQEALLAGRLDVILFGGQELRTGIETRVLLEMPPYMLAPAGHALAGRPQVGLADLARHPLIRPDKPLARPYFDGLFAARGLRPRIVAAADSIEMVRSLVGAGLGLTVLSMRPLTPLSYGGDRLAAVPLEPGLPRLQLMSGRAAGRPRRLVSAFLDALHGWMDGGAGRELIVSGG